MLRLPSDRVDQRVVQVKHDLKFALLRRLPRSDPAASRTGVGGFSLLADAEREGSQGKNSDPKTDGPS